MNKDCNICRKCGRFDLEEAYRGWTTCFVPNLSGGKVMCAHNSCRYCYKQHPKLCDGELVWVNGYIFDPKKVDKSLQKIHLHL